MAVGFFALFDDISILMDDVAVISKVATKKTVGILGDDLAVGADKASGFTASRELPVLWAITKGSLLNKLIILPIAFLLSAFLPWAIIPILMLGGIYLAYEGAEKIYEYFTPHLHPKEHTKVKALSKEKILEVEKKKIKSAILTDFILSIEIVIIALSTVTEQSLTIQIIVVSFIALIATLGVYGIVALLVRMDDVGYALIKKGKDKGSEALQKFGKLLVLALPKVIKSLTVIGTIAMLLVAGGIYVHNIPYLHHLIHGIPSILGELLIGVLIGIVAFIVMQIFLNIKLLLENKL